jgi:AcrR family transcriptional regulator
MRRTKSESEETRQHIIDAAETVFLEMGVSRASLERIAQEAGLTRGAIYWHFSNKQQLFNAMTDRVRSIHSALLETQIEETAADPLAFIEERAFEIVRLFEENEHTRKVYQIIVTRCEYVGEMEEALVWQRSLHDTMAAVFDRAFELAASRGELANGWDARSASTMFHCFISGMLNDWLRYNFNSEFSKSVRCSLRCLLNCFGGSSR